jgi:acyl-CoA thioesterase
MIDEPNADEVRQAQRAAAAMYAEDSASRSLGVVIEDVAPGQATARLRISAAMVNGHRIVHGGYIFLLADTAFAFACNTHGPTVAAAAEIVFLQPASERVRFGQSGIYDVTVRTGAGEVVAEFRGHSRRLRARAE